MKENEKIINYNSIDGTRLSGTFMRETRNLKPEEKIKEINIPILFLQGTEDQTTPYFP